MQISNSKISLHMYTPLKIKDNTIWKQYHLKAWSSSIILVYKYSQISDLLPPPKQWIPWGFQFPV